LTHLGTVLTQAAIQKTNEKKQKELRKLEKQRLIAERKMKREKKKTKRKKKAKRKKKLWTKELKRRRLVQKQKLKAKELQKEQKKKSKEVKVQQFTDFVSIEQMERRPSQIRSTRAERQNKAPKRFDDWFYSLKASYTYQQSVISIAIWFYEWWLNNDKNSMGG